ncbi:MAG TPA: heavy metal-associated domain-containing protein [Thermoanaerobaculia bacterium]|jgi:copper chaperone CopZ|nr:heavy metal-associated domain-containing protein [Thermoanaerobaculia bacterium]
MQRKVVLTLVAFLALAMAAFAVETSTEKVTLKIEGMDCGKCAEKIETALKAVPGVKDAHVSLLKETADVEVNKGVTVASLSDAVNKAGYAVAGQKAAPAHKVGDCGKKCPMMNKPPADKQPG